MASRIRKGDTVVVITGRDKGRSGEVLRVLPKESRVVVRGINVVRRHQRQTPRAEGGIIAKEMPIHISNVAMADAASGRPTRVGFRRDEAGAKVRFAKRSGETIDG